MGTFGVVVIASIALLQPAEGRQRGGGGGGHGRSFSSGHHSSGSGRNFSNHSRNFSGSGANYYRSSPRVSSQAAYRNRAYRASGSSRRYSSPAAYRNRDYSVSGRRRSVDRTTALNPRAYSASRQRVSANRRSELRSQGFNNNQGRVHARYSRNWNRNRDYQWRGNRCRWRNNSWVIVGPWFYPWGYGYYPYGAYSYYDSGYYDDGYASSEYSQEPSRAEYDSGAADFSVSGVQSALAREGYYDGPIDGSLGPATRNALRRYQRDRGLSVTGRIDRSVVQALGLRS